MIVDWHVVLPAHYKFPQADTYLTALLVLSFIHLEMDLFPPKK